MKNAPFMAVIAALAMLAALSPVMAGDGVRVDDFVFSALYREDIHDLDSALKRQWEEPIEFESGATARSCAEYLVESLKSNMASSSYSIRDTFTASLCGGLLALKTAKPHKGWRPESYGKELYNRLDFYSFFNSIRKRMEVTDNSTLAGLKDMKVEFEDRYSAVVEDEGWYELVRVDADADLNGNGKPDWLISVTEQAIGGSILDSATYVIYDVEPEGLLKVSDAPGMWIHPWR